MLLRKVVDFQRTTRRYITADPRKRCMAARRTGRDATSGMGSAHGPGNPASELRLRGSVRCCPWQVTSQPAV
jgi:hypothetical protein